MPLAGMGGLKAGLARLLVGGVRAGRSLLHQWMAHHTSAIIVVVRASKAREHVVHIASASLKVLHRPSLYGV